MKYHRFVSGVFVVGALALMIMIGLSLAPSVGAGDLPIGSQAPTQTVAKKDISTAPPAERQGPMPVGECDKASERQVRTPVGDETARPQFHYFKGPDLSDFNAVVEQDRASSTSF